MAKVWEKLWPVFKTVDFLNRLSALDTTCGTSSWLVQVTVAPIGTVNVSGEKLKLSMTNSLFVALTGADSLVSEFLPWMLLRRANATNKTNARVPVFRCLRNGVRTVMHPVAGLR